MPKPKVLISEDSIKQRIATLSQEITKAASEDIVIVVLLKGAFIFTADLLRSLSDSGLQPEVEFMTLSSYGSGTKSSGHVRVHGDIPLELDGKTVLIVDDILETGNTLVKARQLLSQSGASDVKICVLLQKRITATPEIQADFVGFEIDDHFVVGYGLDYDNRYRELPYIGLL